MNRETCIRCGADVPAGCSVSLQTVMRLAKLPVGSFVDKLVELEGISREAAQAFVDHRMGHACRKTEPPCPGCGTALKTWHAKGCWTCGWRRPAQPPTNG